MKLLIRSLTLLVFLSVPYAVSADSLSLTTYYPAPFGSYSLLRLTPTSDAGVGICDSTKIGQLYLSSDSGEIKICNGTSWGATGLWTLNSATKQVYLLNSPTDTAYKLGIGMTAPNARMHVKGIDDATYGQFEVESTGNDAKITLVNSSGAATDGSGSILMSNTNGSKGLRFMINSVDKMILDSNGRLGVGVTAPDTALHVKGPDNNTLGQVKVESTGNEARLSFLNADGANAAGNGDILMSRTPDLEGLRFLINNSDKMIIDENGQVGIGLTAPTAVFDVSRPAALGLVDMAKFDNIHLIDENETTYTSSALCNGTNCLASNNDFMGLRMFVNTSTNAGNVTLGVPTTGFTTSNITLNVGNTSALTVGSQAVTTDNTVNVGIGVAAPSYKLQVNGPIGGALERANPGNTGELQVNCTTVAGKCYAVYAP